jgi:hypothetical protein
MRFAYGLAAVVGLVCAIACGSSSSNSSGSSGGSSGTAGNSTTTGGTDSTGGTNSTGGSGIGAAGDGNLGEGGVDVPVVSTASPHGATSLVAGGVIAHSANFTGVFSLGQAPGGNGVLTSKNAQLRGGIIGATQK